MDRLRQSRGSAVRVAIIGGGASGTLTAAHLLRCATAGGLRLHIALIDQHGRHGQGVAYSTTHHDHLLNVMAGQMTALPDDPGHLVSWANAAGSDGFPAGSPRVTDTTFIPRSVYGRYLRDVLAATERQARPACRLTRITDEVVAIRRSEGNPALRVALAGSHLDADVAVLATGYSPAALPFDVPPSGRVIADPWLPGALAGPLDSAAGRSVVIVGTGLTMLDLAVAITAARPDVIVHAVSRHGLLPRTHQGIQPRVRQPAWLPAMAMGTGPVQLAELMWHMRADIAASGARWHDVMCSLRPFVPELWQRLTVADKQLFLRRLARYWEVHRHLAPPPTASRVTALRLAGRLKVHRGQARVVTSGRRLTIGVEAARNAVELNADWLINGTGPAPDITTAASPLLRSLFRDGLARPDPLRLGIDAMPDGSVLDAAGSPSSALFTLGPPLRGLWYETTAIPEIRVQAAALAQLITSERRVSERLPGSAA
jgi:uncharacterized NAD(P)/FAD-binding protein YdhS